MSIGNELKNIPDVQPALPLEALLRESKQLQAISLHLIRESRELKTTLVLIERSYRNQQEQLRQHHNLICNNDYNLWCIRTNLLFKPV